MYRGEFQTLISKTTENFIYSQRKFPRRILSLQWPRVMDNKKLLEKAKKKRCCSKNKRKTLNWLRHLLRLDKVTPARRALTSFLNHCKWSHGKLRKTRSSWEPLLQWFRHNCESIIDLIQDLRNICANRNRWKDLVSYIKLHKKCPYSESFWSECRKIRTKITPNTDTF